MVGSPVPLCTFSFPISLPEGLVVWKIFNITLGSCWAENSGIVSRDVYVCGPRRGGRQVLHCTQYVLHKSSEDMPHDEPILSIPFHG